MTPFLRRMLVIIVLSLLAGTAFRAGLHTDAAIFLAALLLLWAQGPEGV